MRKDLQEKLFRQYPKIFPERLRRDSQTSCMYWGLTCGDGWYSIIENLCGQLQHNTDKNDFPQVVAAQVKEKFGGLRFYYDLEGGPDERLPKSIDIGGRRIMLPHRDSSYQNGVIRGMVAAHESMSYSTCESCGTTDPARGVRVSRTDWIRTRCQSCLDGGR